MCSSDLPNVHGMALHADGGVLGSKPYAASGAYINRMSNYCASCEFDSTLKSGDKACPFNFLYWNFLIEGEIDFSANPRMAMPYKHLERMTEQQREDLREDAARFLAAVCPTQAKQARPG